MNGCSEKVYLSLTMPTEENTLSDRERLTLALETLGYEPVDFPLPILRKLYPLCRQADFDVTVTLVRREYDWVVTCVEPGDTRQRHYSLAVDYGSTTIVMQLIDMNSGAVIAEETEINGQVAYGTDILTRITFAKEDPKNPALLRQATIRTLENLLERLTESTGIDVDSCPVMVLSGNTTMIHFLLELDSWTVFAAPYAPVVTNPGFFSGEELGLDFPGQIYIIPAASNYVGGDIVSGLLELELHKQEEVHMFFDIGTNGELVIGNKDWLLAGAGAAGPALEGYISPFGMRAAPGAIDSVKIHGHELSYTTLENQKPVGICGSGIIDLMAQMRLSGWIDVSGQLDPAASARIRKIDGQYAAVYAESWESATGSALYFSQQDIHQYLDTKAAAYTMVDCLLESAGIRETELGRIYLSGAFAAHADLESAITLGIFPDLPREKYRVLRNSSLSGARKLLLNRALLYDAKRLSQHIYCVQFASIPDFLMRMQAAKFIPHTDMGRYPSIVEKLRAK